MIKGYIELNILYLFPEDNSMDILIKQGFKRDGDCYFKLLLKENDKIKYASLKVIKDYYFNLYHKFLIDGENKNLKYIKLNKTNILEEKLIVNRDDVDNAINSQNVMYNHITRQLFNDLSTTNLLKSDLAGEATVNRYSFNNLAKDTETLTITYNLDDMKHDYYNEIIDTYFLSNQTDNYYATNQKYNIESTNHKYQELQDLIKILQNLITKLGTNPAVVGSPILLPTDISTFNQSILNLNQTLNNNFIAEYDNIDMVNQSLNGILHAKQ